MAQYVVFTTGLEMFDALHALGLAVLFAEASGSAVEICDCGVGYELTAVNRSGLLRSDMALTDILTLPVDQCLENASERQLAIWDGLSTACFTMPGPRVASLADARFAASIDPEAIGRGLMKCRNHVARLHKYVMKAAKRSANWIETVLEDYVPERLRYPVPGTWESLGISITMPCEPSFGYATRRPNSDGFVGDKTNVFIEGTIFAPVLVYIGAARFLRAQRVGDGKLVNCYIPVVNRMVVTADTWLPSLHSSKHTSQRAAHITWLDLWQEYSTALQGIAYQVLQTQGAKQSFSVHRDYLPFSRLAYLTELGCKAMVTRWHQLLNQRAETRPFDLDNLLDYFASQQEACLLGHLSEVAWYQHRISESSVFFYCLHEVKVMTELQRHPDSSIATILTREQGTLRFGRSIRLLAEQKSSVVREIVEELDVIHTRDQLMRVLARSAQECQLAKAKSDFIIIPSDDDLRFLLDDVEHFGARDIAGLIILLAALRYPSQPNGQATSPVQTQGLSGLEIETNV